MEKPSFYLLLGEVLRRLAPNSSSGELSGEFGRCSDDLELSEDEAIGPRELLGNKVPFFGGRPIRLPVLDIRGPCLTGLWQKIDSIILQSNMVTIYRQIVFAWIVVFFSLSILNISSVKQQGLQSRLRPFDDF